MFVFNPTEEASSLPNRTAPCPNPGPPFPSPPANGVNPCTRFPSLLLVLSFSGLRRLLPALPDTPVLTLPPPSLRRFNPFHGTVLPGGS